MRKGRRYEEAAHVPTPPKEEPRCWRCGGQLGLTAKFCGDCGAPREVPEAAKPKETASQKSVKVGVDGGVAMA